MPDRSKHRDPRQPLSPRESDQIAEDMGALSAGSRVRILFALTESELTVEALAGRVGLEPNAVSQQLRVLRQLRFVTGTRRGRHISYRLADHHVQDLLAAILHHHEHARGAWSAEDVPALTASR